MQKGYITMNQFEQRLTLYTAHSYVATQFSSKYTVTMRPFAGIKCGAITCTETTVNRCLRSTFIANNPRVDRTKRLPACIPPVSLRSWCHVVADITGPTVE